MAKLTKAQRKERNRKRKEERARQKTDAKANPQPTTQCTADTPPKETKAVSTPRVVNEVKSKDSKQNSNGQTSNEIRRWWMRISWDLVFSACLVIFAFASFIVGKWQWDAMDVQNSIMEDQIRQTDDTLEIMRLEQRAWLAAMSPDLEEFAQSAPIFCVVNIKNLGNTPATILRISAMVDINEHDGRGPGEIVDSVKELLVPRRENVVAPGVTLRFPVEQTPIMVDDRIERINGGTLGMYLVGYVEYKDVSGVVHTTGFCFDYNRLEKKFDAYSEHNYMK